jgi:hypothetical protein
VSVLSVSSCLSVVSFLSVSGEKACDPSHKRTKRQTDNSLRARVCLFHATANRAVAEAVAR